MGRKYGFKKQSTENEVRDFVAYMPSKRYSKTNHGSNRNGGHLAVHSGIAKTHPKW